MVAIRADNRTHMIVRDLAEQDNLSMPEVLARAVEEYRRRRFLERANDAYAALRDRSVEWSEESAERDEWSPSFADGVKDPE